MIRPVRILAAGAVVGLLGAAAILAPNLMAIASEPEKVMASVDKLFPPPFDPERLRKYDVVLDDTVSTEVQHVARVRKIGFGRTEMVSVITTPSGTYSTDGMLSPNVRYPGIEVQEHPSSWLGSYAGEGGTVTYFGFSRGSFFYLNRVWHPNGRS